MNEAVDSAPALPHDRALYSLLVESYARAAGEALVPAGRGPEWLYLDAPFAVLAHDAQPDPRFIYANRTAQLCFEYPWTELIGLTSHRTAPPAERAARQRLLDAVSRGGIVRGYRGLRVARSGRRFWIDGGVVWQLTTPQGAFRGQAALFTSWRDAGD